MRKELKCGVRIDGTQNRLLLLWPTVISHKIDECSPLFDLGPDELHLSSFELIVTIVGIVEETGKYVQVRTSYLPNEVYWGYHFDNDVMKYNPESSTYSLNTKITNKMLKDNYTPRTSAKQLAKDKKEIQASSCLRYKPCDKTNIAKNKLLATT